MPRFRCGEGNQLGLDLGDAAGEVGRVGGLHQFGEFSGFGFGEDSGVGDALVRGPWLVVNAGLFPVFV